MRQVENDAVRRQFLAASGPSRPDIERRMLIAMIVSLRDLTNYPWSAAALAPPNVAFAVAPLALIDMNSLLIAAAFIATVLISWIITITRRAQELERFVDEFGRQVERHMNLAIYFPDAFFGSIGESPFDLLRPT